MRLKLFFASLLFVLTMGALQSSFPVERTNNAVTTKTIANPNQQTNSTTSVENSTEKEEYSSPAITDKGKSQLVALILCIFVGAFGIHRFYLGYTTEGIIQLLTLGGCGIWSLIDLIRIAIGDLQPKKGKYTETI